MTLSSPIIDPKIKSFPFYITRCATDFEGNFVTREKGFNEYQIMQCTSGKGFFECDGRSFIIGPSDLVLFHPHKPHRYGPLPNESAPWILSWICFLTDGNDLLETHLTNDGYRVIQQAPTAHLIPLYEQAVRTLAQPDATYYQLQGAHILYTLLLEVIGLKWTVHKTISHTQLLDTVINYMEAHLHTELSIDDLSDLVHVSPSYLCRQFKKIYQTSPIQYLIKLRMLKAQELMRTCPHLTIKEIGQLCGYREYAYFCAEFKRCFHITPNQYKEEFLHNKRPT